MSALPAEYPGWNAGPPGRGAGAEAEMTYYDVYIAAFEDGDALEWGELARTGHISHRISPLFSAYGLDKGPYEVARYWMRDGRMTSMKVDWGAYAANVDVPDIRRFVSLAMGIGSSEPRAIPRRAGARPLRAGGLRNLKSVL